MRCRKTGRQDEYERTLTLIRSIAFADENPTDRIHAVETLFKLRYFCNEEEQRRLRHFCGDEECPALLKIYSAALLAWSSPEEGAGNLTRLFRQYRDDASCRLVMLVVLQNFRRLPDELLKEIAEVQSNAKYAASRVAASRILLRHRRLFVEQVLADLPPSAEAMRLLLEFAPKSRECQAMIRLLMKSDSLELRMLAVFAKLKIG